MGERRLRRVVADGEWTDGSKLSKDRRERTAGLAEGQQAEGSGGRTGEVDEILLRRLALELALKRRRRRRRRREVGSVASCASQLLGVPSCEHRISPVLAGSLLCSQDLSCARREYELMII